MNKRAHHRADAHPELPLFKVGTLLVPSWVVRLLT
jgi:hypothetical protein